MKRILLINSIHQNLVPKLKLPVLCTTFSVDQKHKTKAGKLTKNMPKSSIKSYTTKYSALYLQFPCIYFVTRYIDGVGTIE